MGTFTNLRPQFYVPGPSKWFINFRDPVTGNLLGWNLLGYCQDRTDFSMIAAYEDIPAEYAGMMPADVQFMGENAFFSANFSKYQEEVFQAIMNYRGKLLADANYGSISSPQVLGDLMLQDNRSYAVSVVSTYAGKLTNKGRLAYAMTFWYCWAHENIDFGLNMRPKMPRLIIRAIPNNDECAQQYRFYYPGIPTGLDPTVCI